MGSENTPAVGGNGIEQYQTTAQAQEIVHPSDTPPAPKSEKNFQTFLDRTKWTFLMIAGFLASLLYGHLAVIILVTVIQVVSFKEVIAVGNIKSKERKIQFSKSLNWYFLGTTMYFLYGENVIYYFKHIVLVDRILGPFATHHRFISFILYVIGFVIFVATLKSGRVGQFTQFGWTHMALLLIVVQAHFTMNNILEGMFWFLMPVSLVIINDISAYVCGIIFGRTQLIELSPKKTVEGFLGAWIATIAIGFGLTKMLIGSKYLICPVNDFGSSYFNPLECDPNPVFLPKVYQIPFALQNTLGASQSVEIEPIMIHFLAFATFASLVAPFGGFFASGVKRALKVKDFGDVFPGHGGVTDRMDCQFTMGFFSFLYYHSFIAIMKVSLGDLLEAAVSGLTAEEQLELATALMKHLSNQGAISEKVVECFSQIP